MTNSNTYVNIEKQSLVVAMNFLSFNKSANNNNNINNTISRANKPTTQPQEQPNHQQQQQQDDGFWKCYSEDEEMVDIEEEHENNRTEEEKESTASTGGSSFMAEPMSFPTWFSSCSNAGQSNVGEPNQQQHEGEQDRLEITITPITEIIRRQPLTQT
ncbi:hypothetical protein ACTFIU_001849 [Dictyostelium citrinum]